MARRHMNRSHATYVANQNGVRNYTLHTPSGARTDQYCADHLAVRWAEGVHRDTGDRVTLVNAGGRVLVDMQGGVNVAPSEGYRYADRCMDYS